jgi:hypothetical protein
MYKLTKTTKIILSSYDLVYDALEFCQAEFGAGGVQRDRRWFYRILNAWDGYLEQVFNHAAQPLFVRQRHRVKAYVAVYFRNAADATWFSLKFEVKND